MPPRAPRPCLTQVLILAAALACQAALSPPISAQQAHLLANIASDAAYSSQLGSFPSQFIHVGDHAFFIAATPTSGSQIWRTDGAFAGTSLAVRTPDLNAYITLLGRSGDQLVYLIQAPYESGFRMLSTRGDSAPPQPISLPPGADTSIVYFDEAVPSGSSLFVYARFQFSTELWAINAAEGVTHTLTAEPVEYGYWPYDHPPTPVPAGDAGGDGVVITQRAFPDNGFSMLRFFARSTGAPGTITPIRTATSDVLYALGPAVKAGPWICLPGLPDGDPIPDSLDSASRVQFYRLAPGSLLAEPFGDPLDQPGIQRAINADTTAYAAGRAGDIVQLDPDLLRVARVGVGHRRIVSKLFEALPVPWATLGRALMFASGGLPSADPISVRIAPGDLTAAPEPTGSYNVNAVGSFGAVSGRFLFEAASFDNTRLLIASDLGGHTTSLANYGYFPPNDSYGSNTSQQLQSSIISLPGFAILPIDDRLHGEEPWRTDGTPEGTRLIRDINPQQDAGSDPQFFAPIGPSVAISCPDRLRVLDPRSGRISALPVQASSTSHATLADRLYFPGRDPLIGFAYGFWETDGTPEGTNFTPTSLRSSNLTPFRGNLLFSGAGQGGQNQSPAVIYSPSTHRATFLVPNPGGSSSSLALCKPFVFVGDRALFLADAPGPGYAVFTTDGSPEHTTPLLLPADESYAYINGGDRAGDDVVFLRQTQLGIEVWRTGGTQASTHLLTTLPLQGGSGPTAGSTGARFIHFAGENLISSDGTSAGTRFFPVPGLTFYAPLATLNNALLFVGATAEAGAELWRTDGTPEGTRLVMDINPGPASSEIQRFSFFQSPVSLARGRLYLSAFTPDFGRELWSTDGTAEGTRRLTDIAPGPDSSSPSALTVIGDRLYFAADDGLIGREPYFIDLCTADFNSDGRLDPDDLADFIACAFSTPPCPQADFNADGTVNPDDLADYIVAYFSGC